MDGAGACSGKERGGEERGRQDHAVEGLGGHLGVKAVRKPQGSRGARPGATRGG
jgi:hypothetical protein